MAEKILVVEDDEYMRFFLTEAVAKRGYEAVPMCDAESALEATSKRTFDLILMDVKLPGMTGIEAVQKIKQIDPQAVIIVMY